MDFTHFTAVEVFDHPNMTEDERLAWINVAPYEELVIADKRTAGRPVYNELILKRIQFRISEQTLLAAKTPHWTMTPVFIIAFLSMVLAAIAAWPVIREWIPSCQPVSINSNSQSQQSNSVSSLPPASKK